MAVLDSVVNAVQCITLHCSVLHFTSLNGTELKWFELHYTTLTWTALYCTVLSCTSLKLKCLRMHFLYNSELKSSRQYCTAGDHITRGLYMVLSSPHTKHTDRALHFTLLIGLAKFSFYIFRWTNRHIVLKCSYVYIVLKYLMGKCSYIRFIKALKCIF